MSDDNTQIVSAYEKSGLSPEDIADSLDMDVIAVKTILSLESSKYRKDTHEDVSDEETTEMFNIVKDIARSTLTRVQHPGVALKAATFLIDEKKGRNDPKGFLKAMSRSGISITMINNRLEGMKQAKARTLDQKAIDLVPA